MDFDVSSSRLQPSLSSPVEQETSVDTPQYLCGRDSSLKNQIQYVYTEAIHAKQCNMVLLLQAGVFFVYSLNLIFDF